MTDNIIAFPDTQSTMIVEQIRAFWKLEDRFKRHGFMHKRGFMLHGPPGSGKTITVNMVIQDILKDGGLVFLTDEQLALRRGLLEVRTMEPDRPIVCILEDFDSIIERHGESDILSLLDGENSINKVVFIATTNYPEKMARRFMNRPSRFDLVVYIGPPNAEARRIYFEQKVHGIFDIKQWVNATEGMGFAHLKELIVSVAVLGNDFNETIKRLSSMKKIPSSGKQEGNGMGFSA